MDLIRLNIKGISYSQTQTGAYALILEENFGKRKIPIIIGEAEAQSIALALEKDLNPPRPLTHDLFTHFAMTFNIEIKAIFIQKLVDGIFYSNILCENLETGKKHELDARTSDAVALAVRFNSPIYTSNDIMDKAGIYMEMKEDEELADVHDTESETKDNQEINSFSHLSNEEIYNLLNKAVENEDYETAVKLRDELTRRKSR